jgi:hypothetical protein
MSNGFIVAAAVDLAAARELADGFGLDLVDASAGGDGPALLASLLSASNVGIVISSASAQDELFFSLMEVLAERLPRAQLIVADAEARAAFSFIPESWPTMPLAEASTRAAALAAQRQPAPAPAPEPPPPPAVEPAPQQMEELRPEPPQPEPEPLPEAEYERGITLEDKSESLESLDDAMGGEAPAEHDEETPATEEQPAPVAAEPPAREEPPAPPVVAAPAPAPAPRAPASVPPALQPNDLTRGAPSVDSGGPQTASPARKRAEAPGADTASSAPADATAFAPKKLRRGTPELVRIVIHQPKDIAAVIKAARQIDPRTAPAPQGMSIGEVALGASVGVSLEVRGGACDGTLQRRTWAGAPIDFSFSVDAEADVKQAVILARVFVNDAQIGVIAFTRPITGATKAAPIGDKARMKRHKRVFLSYSSKDRETVSAIATAYQMAGVQYFWDRASLKSGEEWHPRLRREIDRADLFHLCWSKSAATSEWVEREAAYALTRRRRSNGKKPDITVQMLDGPPWAPHPPALDSINFDDFVRAAIVGYARGDGSE